MTDQILHYQPELCPTIPVVLNNVDYNNFETLLRRIDQLLITTELQRKFESLSFNIWLQTNPDASVSSMLAHQRSCHQALRCNILAKLKQSSFRGLSRSLAEAPLYRWFCGFERLGPVQVPAKSTLQRYQTWLPKEQMDALLDQFIQSLNDPNVQELITEVDLETVWVDATCVRANIHFPVDWVLLRDATRTLMKATVRIRKQGIKNRMEDPTTFSKRMNGLVMAMTQGSRGPDSKNQRKAVFRQIRKLIRKIHRHAQKHRDLLESQWTQTQWSEKEMRQVLRQIDNVLEQLPEAEEQAAQRIIKEQKVRSKEKILSLYEPDVNVVTRGKLGAKVEFGNVLRLVEQKDGLIVEWEMYREAAPGDTQQLPDCLENLEELGLKVKAIFGDRGYDSEANRQLLADQEVYNGLCAKNPHTLKRQFQDPYFRENQQRRSQTEARIAIVKNDFAGAPMREKGFEHRELGMSWAILTHNLWVLARKKWREEPKELQIAA